MKVPMTEELTNSEGSNDRKLKKNEGSNDKGTKEK